MVEAKHPVLIKDKLGNKSNASTEMEFQDTYGVMVGEEGRGIRTIIDMVTGNRMYCAMWPAPMRAPRPRGGEVRARPGMHQEQYELMVLEAGPPAEIELDWLNDTHPDARKAKEKQEGGKSYFLSFAVSSLRKSGNYY